MRDPTHSFYQNLASMLIDIRIIIKKLADNLKYHWVEEITIITLPFIFFSLNFMPKNHRSWNKIYHLFYLITHSVNYNICDGASEMRYTWFQNISEIVILADKN